MTIQNSFVIRGEADSCTIEVRPTGNIQIGSVSLKPNELAEFPKLLEQALSKIAKLNQEVV